MKPLLFTIITVLASLLFNTAALAQEEVPRYEVGGQFSSLARNRPTMQGEEFFQLEDFDVIFPRRVTELGFGGRFTYNLTNKIAFEAERNFFPKRNELFGVPDGRIIQCQFGVKTGKRFKKFGLFAKARPGFVTFTQTSLFTGFEAEFVPDPSRGAALLFDVPQFCIGRASYFSTDIGSVVEFYPSRRLVTRFDVGDTIIRYGEYGEQAAVVCPLCCACPPQLFLRPPETKHSLQFSAGVAFRF